MSSKKKKKPDLVSYTDSQGEKHHVPFKSWVVDIAVNELRQNLILHKHLMGMYESGHIKDSKKFQWWYTYLYSSEKMICNWKSLPNDRVFEGAFAFDEDIVKELELKFADYKPFLSDEVLLAVNDMGDYDVLGITFLEANQNIKTHLRLNIGEIGTLVPTVYDSDFVLTQDLTWAMLDKCLSNINYQLSDEESEYSKHDNYSKQSTRWVEEKLTSVKEDKDSYFTQFEIILGNNMQPTYKLCSRFNRQLHMVQVPGDKFKASGREEKIHLVVQSKFKELFIDWFRNKHANFRKQTLKEEGKVDKYEVSIAVVVIGGVEHLMTRLNESLDYNEGKPYVKI